MKTAFPPSMRTRPVYGELAPQPGSAHLMIADGEGGDALAELLAGAPALLPAAHVIYVTGANGADRSAGLAALRPASFLHAPSWGAAEQRVRKALADGHMGLRIYLAGTEGLIGLAMREAIAAGYPHDAIATEHRGSLARRVQCVHCKGVTEAVTTNPVRCAHCGLMLTVRDHYSRRLAAFQGVNIDAEDPGTAPAPVETWP